MATHKNNFRKIRRNLQEFKPKIEPPKKGRCAIKKLKYKPNWFDDCD